MTKMDRRRFLRTSIFGCACCMGAIGAARAETVPAASAAAHSGGYWDYVGEAGPEHWGDLRPDFKACKLGLEQTPINLAYSIKGETGPIDFNYSAQPMKVLNNGHTIQVDGMKGSDVVVGGERYSLAQFHFHHPSEHILSGKPFDMELHLVHKSAAGVLAVVGVFIKAGARNAALAPVFDAMPAQTDGSAQIGAIDPNDFLPHDRSYFRYMGSLTTPPCSEGVVWSVFREPIDASADQIRRFANLFPANARPVQRQNTRFLIETN
jgi:carbonic anhydrase